MKLVRRIWEYAFFGIAALYFPCVFFVSALLPTGGGLMPSSYMLNLLAVLLVSLPCFVSFVSLYLLGETWTEYRRSAKAIASLAVGIALIVLQLVSYINLSKLLPLSVWSAILQIIFWSVHAIVSAAKKKRPTVKAVLKNRIFWLSVALSFVAIAAVGLGVKAAFEAVPQLSGKKEDLSYEMMCEGETVKANRGDHITLTVTLKNNSGEDYSYEGSYSQLKPEIILVSENNESFKIPHDDMPFTNDFAKHMLRHGEERITLFYFTVPENAPEGSYRAVMTFMNSTAEQDGVLKVEK